MKLRFVALSAGLTITLAFGVAAAQDKDHGHTHDKPAVDAKDKAPKLPICPVMNQPIDFNVKTMADDGPVYFCCGGCVKKYDGEPEKYAKRLAEQRAALAKLERIQVACPVAGEPIDPKTETKTEDGSVAFCCAGCKGKYEADPAKYQAKLADSHTYQTRCPVSGEKVDIKSYVDMPTGERVYLCCAGCKDKMLSDPAKYAPKLAEQGVNLNLRKIKRMQAEGDKAADRP